MLHWFRNLSIITKTTLLLSFAATCFLLLLSSGSYYFAHQELQQTIATNQTATVTSLAGQLDDKLQAAKQLLHHLTDHLQEDNVYPTAGKLQEALKHYQVALLFFDAGLTVLSPEGRIVATYPHDQDRIGLDLSFRDHYKQVVATHKSFVSSPFSSYMPPHQPVVAFSVPMFDRQGTLTGVLVGRHSLKDSGFLERLISEPIGSSGYFYLFDQQRMLLLHPIPSRIMTTVPAGGNQAMDAALQGWHGTRENTNSKGLSGLTSVQPLKEAPWFLAAHYPLEEAYAPLQRARVAFVLVLIVSLVFAMVAVWFSMQPVVRPLHRLTSHLANLAGKEGLNRFLPVTSKDEIGQLSTVFNELLQELDDEAAAREETAMAYRIITEFTNEVSIWRLENGDVRYISPNCAQEFGYQDFEFYADPSLLTTMFHPDDLQLWDSHKRGGCSRGGSGIEIRLIVKDGSVRYFRHYCHPVTDQQGRPNGVRSSWLDITGHQQLETTMRKLTRAVEQSASVIVMTDTEGAIQYVNPSFCSTTGYTAEEALGQNPRVLKSGSMAPEIYTELWRTITSGKEWRGEFINKRKDGSLYWESASISPLTDKTGAIIGYLAVKEDITEQKTAEQRMKELFNQVEQAKQEWEQTLDHLHDFIILADANQNIRRYNRILADMTSLPVNELTGQDWRTLLQEAGFSFLNFNGSRGELLHPRSGRTYDINIYPIGEGQEALKGYVISLNDTTELRAMTQELQKTLAELNDAQSQIYQQEKMASVGQLAAGVAHEINNPMGFITSNLGSLDKYVNRLAEYISVIDQAMQGCCAGEHTTTVLEARKRLKVDRILDDAHQLIAESQDGAGRVRRIVQDLKSFSRVDQAETALVDLNESLETTINIAWNEIKYVADLKREFGDIPKVACYPQQLNQVFLNLLVNAAHALGETHGEITVRTEQAGDWILIKVSDTGCGIPEEIRTRIFEPFFTTKEVGKGTGLGLSISYDIIKKHGGSIEIQSEVGRGTTFTVRLPIGHHHGEQ